jgi:hypothetical protein
MTALVDKFHPGTAAISIENLIRIGCLGVDFKTEGERNTPALPRPEQVGRMGRPEWQKLIKGFAEVREHVTATVIGKALAEAVREHPAAK